MRILITFFALSLLISSTLFGQGKIAKITNERWNGDEAVWHSETEETWDYDDFGRQVLYTHHIAQLSDYLAYNRKRVHYEYNNQNKLTKETSQLWGFSSFDGDYFNEFEKSFSYEGNQLVEIFEKYKYSRIEDINYNKTTFEVNEEERRRTLEYYSGKNDQNNLVFGYRRDSLFDENGCLIKSTIFSKNDDGIIVNNRWTTFTQNENCQPIISAYWKKNEQTDTAINSYRHTYEYLNNGKISRETYEDFDQNSGEWITKSFREIEEDKEGQYYRNFMELYRWNYTDTIMQVNEYNEEGEPITLRTYKSAYSNDRPFRQTRVDSFLYFHDDEGKLILKERYQKSYDNPYRKMTEHYDYFCNGQLKSILYEDLPDVRRTIYEYHGKSDCEETESAQFLKVFPNPSNGFMRVESNLLSSEDATIQVFTVLGQEVFNEKINRVTERFLIDLPDLVSGQYIITLTTKNQTLTEKIMVN